MSLSHITQAVTEKVGAVSGYPVVVQPDPLLPTLAKVRMARGAVPFHTVFFNSASGLGQEYLICFQCGHILRAFSVPAPGRVDFVGKQSGRDAVGKLIKNTINRQILSALGQAGLDRLRDQMFDGLMPQLRSMPVGLRVDAWITREYPELAEQQREAAARQLNDNAASLQPEVRQMTPPKVYRPSLTMNAAFAEYWAGRMGQPQLTLPYKATNFLDSGKRLLSIFEKVPDDPAEDRRLIDAWAGELGLAGWYEWVPHRVDA
jgi:hypothetical protein